MVIPSQCPIPPGFEVIGHLSDDFDHFKDTTGYPDFESANNPSEGPNEGFSKRWKNSNIRSVNIVCGFQFKIGPDVGWRWRNVEGSREIIDKVRAGDVNLHFPRSGLVRGGYIVTIKWYINTEIGEGFLTRGKLIKEVPHGTYGSKLNDTPYFLADTYQFRGQPNPNEGLEQALDGKWHSFLAVIFNDYYLGSQTTIGLPSPTIGLWYSHIPTHKYEDFKFIGMSIDKKGVTPDGTIIPSMFPNGPLIGSIEHSPEIGGDEIFTPEHALQIRTDDVPIDQVEIRNVYAANVVYRGAIPPPNPPENCVPQAKAVSDAQAKLDDVFSTV